MQGTEEHFRDSCGGAADWLDRQTYYTAFTEGWALYAENPLIAKDTDTYDNEPMQRFGMLKWQVSLHPLYSSQIEELVLHRSFSYVLLCNEDDETNLL